MANDTTRTRNTPAAPKVPLPRSSAGRAVPENPDLDSPMDQAEGIGQSGMDFQEAHEGGLGADRALGAEENRSRDEAPGDGIADESVNPDTSFRAGYSLEDEGRRRDVPVFDRGEEMPGQPEGDDEEPGAAEAKRTQ